MLWRSGKPGVFPVGVAKRDPCARNAEPVDVLRHDIHLLIERRDDVATLFKLNLLDLSQYSTSLLLIDGGVCLPIESVLLLAGEVRRVKWRGWQPYLCNHARNRAVREEVLRKRPLC